jgi:hypothetical protein
MIKITYKTVNCDSNGWGVSTFMWINNLPIFYMGILNYLLKAWRVVKTIN